MPYLVPIRPICATLVALLGLVVSACAGGSSDDAPPAPAAGEAISAGSGAPVGSWELDGKADTDFVVTWWDKLTVNADGTFTGNEGGNVCDDDGNCEAGTTADLKGTYTIGSSGDKKTILFHFSDKGRTTDRFTFSVSGGTMKMQLAADKAKGGDFAMKKK
jgi:hypothetical protein